MKLDLNKRQLEILSCCIDDYYKDVCDIFHHCDKGLAKIKINQLLDELDILRKMVFDAKESNNNT